MATAALFAPPAGAARAAGCRPVAAARRAALAAPRAAALASASSAFAAGPLSAPLQGCTASTSQPLGRQALSVRAGNKGDGGPFAPLVRLARNVIGVKPFNTLRGKAISLHSQVIKEFCTALGAETKQIQGLIRLAKKNGEKLGFLA